MAHELLTPIHRLFNRFPHYEYGLATPILTRLECDHPSLAGRRAVQITDLHLDRYQTRHDTVLHHILELEPDWIFVTGDLLNVPEGFPHLVRFLSSLRGIAPVFMTLGNHDHYSGVSVERFRQLAAERDLTLLVNETVVITAGEGELGIIGLDDPSTYRADVRCIPARQTGRFTVLLAHAPNVLDLLDRQHAVDLILCGHSHGGQWRVPNMRPLWLPYGCRGRAEGYYRRNGHQMYVNRGIGWFLVPIRWNCPPEVVLVEWVAEG